MPSQGIQLLIEDIGNSTTSTATFNKAKTLSTLWLVSCSGTVQSSQPHYGTHIKTELDRALSSTLQAQALINSAASTTKLSNSTQEHFSMLIEMLGEGQQYLQVQQTSEVWRDVWSPALSYALLNFCRT